MLGAKVDEMPGRACPQCNAGVTPERFSGPDGTIWFWRCPCGWSSAMAESGVVLRRRLKEALG